MAYLLLAVAGLIPAARLIWGRNDGRLLALYLIAGNVVLTGDLVALGLLELYEYRPGVFRNPLMDQALGVLCAEVAFVAGLTVVLAALAPTWGGVALGVAIVVVLEILFLRLGLFVHHGWQLWHTAVGFTIYFGGLLWAWQAGWTPVWLRIGIAGWWWHNVAMVVTWAAPQLVMPVYLLPEFYPNQALMAALTSAPTMVPAMVWVMSAPVGDVRRRGLVAAAVILLIDLFWVGTGVWEFRAPYSLAWHYSVQLGMVAASVLTQRWILGLSQPEAPARL